MSVGGAVKEGRREPRLAGQRGRSLGAVPRRRRAVRSLGRVTTVAFVILVLAFLFLPMVLIVLFAFSASPTLSFPVNGLTFDWFKQAFSDPLAMQALKNSLLLACVTMVVSGVVGTMAAFGARRFRPRTRERLTYAALVPSIIPALIIGIGLAVTLNAIGVVLTLKTALIGHVVITLPFVFLTMRARLETFDASVVEAARDLGASPRRAFWDVTLRLVSPAILAAALISMSLSLDEFIITSFTIGADQTLPVLIWARMRTGVSPEVNALATLVLCGTLTTGLIAYRLSRLRL
jgi:spermidine/putrescine transport system permease protein